MGEWAKAIVKFLWRVDFLGCDRVHEFPDYVMIEAELILHFGVVTMSPQLQQIYQDLGEITAIERWQILEHLMGQFKGALGETSSVTATTKPSAQEILTTTQGSWGQRSLDEIDAQMAHQRQMDWGE
jgi:hypothetical protein